MPVVPYIWLLLLYTMLITFFVALGPHYIWAAWMVMAAVMAAFLFGLRGAVFAVILNILILIALYFTIDANNLAWANVFTEPFGKWVIFIINVSLITIVSTFPVAFLLKRLDISLKHEKNATETLSKETMELKKNNKEIKKYTENLKAIFDSAPNVLALVDENIRVEIINQKGAAFVGKDKETLSGRLCGDVFNCRNAVSSMSFFTKPECLNCPLRTYIVSTFETGKTYTEEEGQMTFLLNGQETTMDILISTCLLKINNSKKVLLSLTDITERKSFETSLMESESRFSEMFEHMSSGGAVYEPIENGEDFVFKALNTAAEEISNIQRKDVLGKRLLEIFPMMDKSGLFSALKEVWKSGEPIHLNPFYYKDAFREGWRENRIYKLPSGEVVALFDDVTLRIEAESKIKESEIKYRRLFHKSNDGIVVLNLNGQILDTNFKIEKMLGYKKEELNQLSFQDLHPHFDLERPKKSFEKTKTKGHSRFETKLIKRNGTIIDVEVSSSIVDRETGIVQGIVRDLTDKKKMEKRVIQAQKMESIGNLAGGIAHDFNNLLFLIIGISEMLLEDLPPESFHYENVQKILKAGERGAGLVKQILSFSRQDKYIKTPVRVQQIVEEVIKLIQSTIPANIEIRNYLQPDCGLVMADPTQLHQIAMNLIINAFHATEKSGGKIDIKVKEITMDENHLIGRIEKPGKYVIFSVSDNGSGVPSVHLQKIFDPFFTTKEQGKGTGLGLSVVYGLVKDHQGEITVYSEVGQGTTFNVYLPLNKQNSQFKKTKENQLIEMGTEKILLVDDESFIVELEKQILERQGYFVDERTSSLDALEAFKANPDSYDLVISDMNMPGITGVQLAKAMLAIRSDLPIIICTGFSDLVSEKMCEDIGIKGFLMKPIIMSEMTKEVRRVLDEAKYQNQT